MIRPSIRHAATVILLRNTESGFETLLLKRNLSLNVLGGYWVFPGGNMDDSDDGNSLPERLTRTAARETLEESGIAVEPAKLCWFARWVTPEGIPRRFDTHFFFVQVDSPQVIIDQEEIIDYRWISFDQAIALHQAGDMQMMPPTLITLMQFLPFTQVSSLSEHFTGLPLQTFLPKIANSQPLCMLYQDDYLYSDAPANAKTIRHRCLWEGNHWRYIDERVALMAKQGEWI